jgi:sugar transferase (PEP-CTERM/EpsH1 system associated)
MTCSTCGLLRNEPLTLSYYQDQTMCRWVDDLLVNRQVDCALVFSSSMAQYATDAQVPLWVDFVDVDSAKWTEYAGAHRWPMSWLYGREGSALLRYERLVATRADHSFFATDKEAAMFHALAPESAHKVSALGNGVDSDYFAPASGCRTPFSQDEQTLVFTGAMDYWPNIDAVTWFAKEMFPRLRAHWPRLHFHIVGRSPTAAVRALAGDAVHVTGTVPDVRPYLQHADVVVAPLRLARGIQNKVLEAMAMARPVVAAAACVEAIDCAPGEHLVAAADAADYVREIDALLSDPQRASQVGAAGRAQVVAVYGWDARLQTLDAHLGSCLQGVT